jgi:hypothetical protein
MVTVKMPRANWDAVIECLKLLQNQGLLTGPVIKEISDQVDRQEY